MIPKLFPEYQYVKFGPMGIILLSKSFWSFIFSTYTSIHITELCTVLIPERLEKLDTRTSDGEITSYQRIYNKYSHIVLDLLHHRTNNVIDYLYDEYTYIKYGIHKQYYTVNNVLPQPTYTLSELLVNPVKKDSIVLSRLSNAYIKEALKRWKSAPVLNHPILYRDFLNMWFRSEIKQELNRICNMRISIST